MSYTHRLGLFQGYILQVSTTKPSHCLCMEHWRFGVNNCPLPCPQIQSLLGLLSTGTKKVSREPRANHSPAQQYASWLTRTEPFAMERPQKERTSSCSRQLKTLQFIRNEGNLARTWLSHKHADCLVIATSDGVGKRNPKREQCKHSTHTRGPPRPLRGRLPCDVISITWHQLGYRWLLRATGFKN